MEKMAYQQISAIVNARNSMDYRTFRTKTELLKILSFIMRGNINGDNGFGLILTNLDLIIIC